MYLPFDFSLFCLLAFKTVLVLIIPFNVSEIPNKTVLFITLLLASYIVLSIHLSNVNEVVCLFFNHTMIVIHRTFSPSHH